MNPFSLIVVAIVAFGLFKDYKRDAGLNKKAKAYHAVLLSLLLITYAGSFGIIGQLLRNFGEIKAAVSVDVGIVPGQVHFIFYFLNVLVSLVVLLSAYQMISRNEQARKRLVTLLPFLGFLSIFSFYKSWIVSDDDLLIDHWIILLLGTVFMGGLAAIYFKIYNSHWMQTFFRFEPEAPNVKLDTLDEENLA